MAAEAETKSPPTDAQTVGKAFVEQYYLILQKSTELAYRFYQETSVLSRPGPDGVMTTVTTTKDINEKIMAVDYSKIKAVILTSDAQMSHQDGVIVLVTGYLTGEESMKKRFSQTFFLAPQNNGYFVLNDVLRYVDDHESVGADPASVTAGDDNPTKVAPTPVAEPTQTDAAVNHAPVSEDAGNKKEVPKPAIDTGAKANEKEAAADLVKSSHSNVHPGAAEMSLSSKSENAPKKTFASIVNKLKENTAPFHVKIAPAKPKIQPRPSAPAESSASNVHNGPEKNQSGSAKSNSVFVGRLPLNATQAQVREAFERFGPIKPDGIQVRSNKTQGLCFGFVDFESSNAMEAALQADEVMVAGYRVNIEEAKKTRDNDKGRFPSGRGGFRNDNFRGRGDSGGGGNFGGGRGYSRNESEKRGEFSGRNRHNGEGGQTGEGHRKGNQNGVGKGAAAAH